MLNSQPPTTAPTTPSTISRMTPSPVLFTSLLPMKPAIKPNTIHARIDIIYLLSLVPFRQSNCAKFAGPGCPYFGSTPRAGPDSTLKQPDCRHLSRAALPFCYKHPLAQTPPATVLQTAPSHPCPRS